MLERERDGGPFLNEVPCREANRLRVNSREFSIECAVPKVAPHISFAREFGVGDGTVIECVFHFAALDLAYGMAAAYLERTIV